MESGWDLCMESGWDSSLTEGKILQKRKRSTSPENMSEGSKREIQKIKKDLEECQRTVNELREKYEASTLEYEKMVAVIPASHNRNCLLSLFLYLFHSFLILRYLSCHASFASCPGWGTGEKTGRHVYWRVGTWCPVFEPVPHPGRLAFSHA
ncbi:Hypothetical predicted protein [Olea europaea subsp. europaea]|uniref:Uncharacterized protein n=1 Tax=Olea europaea subsp. europaea TaxID=158383 RepID=A0A8S0PN67_OLEEU|nr:Hypothetical predicted protein [Olea europaea subsp. europaea]